METRTGREIIHRPFGSYPYFGENIAGFGGIFFSTLRRRAAMRGTEGLGVGVIGGSPIPLFRI